MLPEYIYLIIHFRTLRFNLTIIIIIIIMYYVSYLSQLLAVPALNLRHNRAKSIAG